jgi:nicotinate-nucleotide pyrophosphorylase (carboxylating)
MTGLPPPDAALIEQQVRLALAEDIGSGDVSAMLVEDRPLQARLIAREPAVLAGRPWFEACFRALDGGIRFDWEFADGDTLPGGETLVCSLHGSSRALLSGERCALNFLQTLSGTATATRRYVEAVAGTATRILDTRKTLPGLRLAQKYAVRCGGADNHRLGLYDAVMLKENHILAAGGIAAAMRAARARHPELPLIVEVETLDELDQVLAEGSASRALLDDFDLDMMREAVERSAGRLPLEVSGGVELIYLRDIAETGVDCISIGALTKHLRAVDFSLRFASQEAAG